jgi:hypothetical protein
MSRGPGPLAAGLAVDQALDLSAVDQPALVLPRTAVRAASSTPSIVDRCFSAASVTARCRRLASAGLHRAADSASPAGGASVPALQYRLQYTGAVQATPRRGRTPAAPCVFQFARAPTARSPEDSPRL